MRLYYSSFDSQGSKSDRYFFNVLPGTYIEALHSAYSHVFFFSTLHLKLTLVSFTLLHILVDLPMKMLKNEANKVAVEDTLRRHYFSVSHRWNNFMFPVFQAITF